MSRWELGDFGGVEERSGELGVRSTPPSSDSLGLFDRSSHQAAQGVSQRKLAARTAEQSRAAGPPTYEPGARRLIRTLRCTDKAPQPRQANHPSHPRQGQRPNGEPQAVSASTPNHTVRPSQWLSLKALKQSSRTRPLINQPCHSACPAATASDRS